MHFLSLYFEARAIWQSRREKKKKREKSSCFRRRGEHLYALFLFRAHVVILSPATGDNAIAIVKQWKYGHFASAVARTSARPARVYARQAYARHTHSTLRIVAIVSFFKRSPPATQRKLSGEITSARAKDER